MLIKAFIAVMEKGSQNSLYINTSVEFILLIPLKLKSIYSSPSLSMLSGHSQERPPSLMWPEIFVATTMNAFSSPSRQRPLL